MQLLGRTESSVLDQLHVAVVVTDLDGVITHWNPHAEALFGWTGREAIGRTAVDLLIPAGAETGAETIIREVIADRSWSGEYQVVRKDGRTLDVYVTDSLVTDEHGEPTAIAGFSFDITQRKRTERRLAVQYGVTQALAESKTLAEATRRILQEICTIAGWDFGAVWTYDDDRDVLACVQTWVSDPAAMRPMVEETRRLEVRPGEGLPGAVFASRAPRWSAEILADPVFARADAAGTAGLRSAAAFPIVLGTDALGVLEFFGTDLREPDRDLSRLLEAIAGQVGQFVERTEAEADVRRTEARRRAILEASLDAIVAMDEGGRITEFSRAAERTFGYSRDEAIGRELAELLIPPDLRDRHRAGLERFRTTGESTLLGRRVELTALRRDGTEFPIELALTRVDLPGPLLFKGAIRDITDRKHAEAELAQMFAEEQRARAQAEQAGRRLTFLAEAGTMLASARDFASALEALARLAVSVLADLCLIDVIDDDGEIRRMVAVHRDPAKEALTLELQTRYAPKRGAPQPAARVIETGKPEFAAEMTEEFLRATTQDEEHFRIARELGMQSYVCVPLVARDRIVGTITLVSTDPAHRFGPTDVTVADDIGRRTALALENIRLLESEQRARRRAERSAARTAVLQSVTAALSGALSSREVTRIVLEEAVGQLGADTGAVGVVRPGGQEIETTQTIGYPSDVLERHHLTPLASTYPMAQAVRSRSPVFVHSRGELLERYDEWARRARSQAFACVPITVEERAVGALFLGFAHPRTFSDEDIQLLEALGRQAGHALERTRLYEAERQARAEAERARRQLAMLSEASSVLAAGIVDFERVLSMAAELAVPFFADWCAVDILRDDGSIERMAIAHSDPAKRELGRELQRRYPADPDAPGGVARVLRTGRAELIPEITDQMLVEAAPDDEFLRKVRAIGLRSLIIVPLVARGRTLGAMSLATAESRRVYAPEDQALAEDLARRIALAMDNARLYHERSSTARTLQQTLLPPELPAIPGIELAALYRPSGEGNEIGGDFYDLFEAGDGSWGVVMGDVCGKGVDAASVTGLVRHTVRAVAMRERRPSTILATLNEALNRQSVGERFCTVCYVRVTTNGRQARLTVSSGGHPLPIVLRAGGETEAVGRPGTLLGVFPEPALTDSAVDLAPGDALVLYTDGLTEERNGHEMFGEGRLHEALASAAGLDAQGIANILVEAVHRFRPEAPRDDLAVLALRVTP
ncbi:MAG: GAF domain-containing protein [Actinomycetota bacterium]